METTVRIFSFVALNIPTVPATTDTTSRYGMIISGSRQNFSPFDSLGVLVSAEELEQKTTASKASTSAVTKTSTYWSHSIEINNKATTEYLQQQNRRVTQSPKDFSVTSFQSSEGYSK